MTTFENGRRSQSVAAYPTREYRPDLDGLRAVAVLPVLLYHFGVPGVGGGFVGVDVFFVLSGFFITSILMADLNAGRFSILTFYERRIRRVVPALILVLAATALAGWFILLPADFKDFGVSLLATLGFASNIYFWLSSGYFDTAAEIKPLLHTWSLAVEEQFYIFFPPALALAYRLGRRWLIFGLVAVAVLSLALGIWAAYNRPSPGFYLAPMRAWELLLGCLLAQQLMGIRARAVLEIASVGGLVLIIGSIVLIDADSPFPGWRALFPCLGTSLIIWASLSGGGIGNRLLSFSPLVFVGKISYSLYLWHWPISAYLRYATGRDPSGLEAVGMFAASMLLATLSWHFVEQPFRGRKSRVTVKQLAVFTGASALALAAVGAALIATNGAPNRFAPGALRYLAEEPGVIPPECFGMPAAQVSAGGSCTIGDPDASGVTFAVWGDSHASRTALPAQQLAAEMGLKGLDLTTGSCPPLLGIDWPMIGCRAFNDAAFEQIRRNGTQLVVLSAMWASYAEGVPFGRTGSPHFVVDEQSVERSQEDNRRVFGAALERTVARLREAGAKVLIVGPVPEIGWDVPRALTRAQVYGAAPPLLTKETFLARQTAVIPPLERLETVPGVTVAWPHRSLCEERCRVEYAEKALYIDDNHLSLYGTSILRGALRRSFADIADEASARRQ